MMQFPLCFTAAVNGQLVQQDCGLIMCPEEVPVCEDDQQLRVPIGQCCKVCVKKGIHFTRFGFSMHENF